MIFGDSLASVDEATGIARLLTELAQINLACLESRITKQMPNDRDARGSVYESPVRPLRHAHSKSNLSSPKLNRLPSLSAS